MSSDIEKARGNEPSSPPGSPRFKRSSSTFSDVSQSSGASSLSILRVKRNESGKTRIRIVEPSMGSYRINTEKTVASLILGKGSHAEALLFRLSVKEKWPSRILWSLWWCGATCGMLHLGNMGGGVLAYFSILMLPLPCFAFLVLSTDLVRQVAQCFECYLISGMQALLLLTSVHLLRDRRAVFWVCLYPTMICASMVDAYPAKFRAMFSKCFFTSLGAVYMIWLFFLFFGWLDPIFDRNWEAGQLSGKAVSSIAQNTATLLAFCGRQLASAVMTPDNYVLIVSPMKTSRIFVEPEVELEDGILKPTGKFVREADNRPARLEMAGEEMDAYAKSDVESANTVWTVASTLAITGDPSSIYSSEVAAVAKAGRTSEESRTNSLNGTTPMPLERKIEDVKKIQVLILESKEAPRSATDSTRTDDTDGVDTVQRDAQVPKPVGEEPVNFPIDSRIGKSEGDCSTDQRHAKERGELALVTEGEYHSRHGHHHEHHHVHLHEHYHRDQHKGNDKEDEFSGLTTRIISV